MKLFILASILVLFTIGIVGMQDADAGPPPLHSIGVTDITVIGENNSINVDEQTRINVDYILETYRPIEFALLVQITDDNDQVVMLNWVEGFEDANMDSDGYVCGDSICKDREGQEKTMTTSWIPLKSGEYQITLFAWESVDNPTALGPPVTRYFTVESNDTFELIECKEDHTLVFRSNDMSACVKPTTAEKLVERGWVVKHFDTSSCIDIVAERKNTGIPFELPSKLPSNFQLVDIEKYPATEILILSFSSDDCGVRTNLHNGELEVRASLKTETYNELEFENSTKSRLLSLPRHDHYEFFKINDHFAWGYEPESESGLYPGRVSFTGDNVNMFYTLQGYHTLFVLKMIAESFGIDDAVEDIPVEFLLSPKVCAEQGGYYNHCPTCSEFVQCEPCMPYCIVK